MSSSHARDAPSTPTPSAPLFYSIGGLSPARRSPHYLQAEHHVSASHSLPLRAGQAARPRQKCVYCNLLSGYCCGVCARARRSSPWCIVKKRASTAPTRRGAWHASASVPIATSLGRLGPASLPARPGRRRHSTSARPCLIMTGRGELQIIPVCWYRNFCLIYIVHFASL